MDWAKRTSLILAAGCVLAAAAVAVSKRVVAHPARHGMLVVTGQVMVPLYPGRVAPVDLRITNRYPFPLRITRLRIRAKVDFAHRLAGCSVRRDFSVWQMPRWEFPIRIGALRTASLRELEVLAKPLVQMRNLPRVNQDACRGARLLLTYEAMAVRDRPGGGAVRP